MPSACNVLVLIGKANSGLTSESPGKLINTQIARVCDSVSDSEVGLQKFAFLTSS